MAKLRTEHSRHLGSVFLAESDAMRCGYIKDYLTEDEIDKVRVRKLLQRAKILEQNIKSTIKKQRAKNKEQEQRRS